MDELEKRVEERVGAIMEKKMDEVSLVIADKVTHQVIKTLGRMIKAKGKLGQSAPTETVPIISQGQKGTQDINKPDGKETNSDSHIETDITNQNTQWMLSALKEIETTPTKSSDSPHDKIILESLAEQT